MDAPEAAMFVVVVEEAGRGAGRGATSSSV